MCRIATVTTKSWQGSTTFKGKEEKNVQSLPFLLVVIFVFHQFLDFKMFSTSVKVVDVDLQVTVAQCQAFSSMTRASERKE